MALQEMTEVPFRCVDEINQGMDEHNEKRVWELLVESAESHSAQFFYLAPKFPQHLKFDKNMHIHFPYKVKRWPINQGMDEHNEKRILPNFSTSPPNFHSI